VGDGWRNADMGVLVMTGVAAIGDSVGIAVADGRGVAFVTGRCVAVGGAIGAAEVGTAVAGDGEVATDEVIGDVLAGAVVGTTAGGLAAQAQSRMVGMATTKPRRVQRRAGMALLALSGVSPEPTAQLAGQLAIRRGAPRRRIVLEDWLTVARGLGETDAARDDRVEDLSRKVRADLLDNLLG